MAIESDLQYGLCVTPRNFVKTLYAGEGMRGIAGCFSRLVRLISIAYLDDIFTSAFNLALTPTILKRKIAVLHAPD